MLMKGADTKKKVYKLVLANDDIHSFDYVIEALVKVCGHTLEQAEQCAFITHYKGRCEVKIEGLKEVSIMLASLCKLELTASIEK